MCTPQCVLRGLKQEEFGKVIMALMHWAGHLAGADPTKLIEDLAKRKKIKTLGVSMGQGQEIIARRYMATATAEGQWVLLQNTHLGLAYLSEVRAAPAAPCPAWPLHLQSCLVACKEYAAQ